MKSLKAKFKKADVSAIPGDVGTRGPAVGCSLGHEELGISLRMSPGMLWSRTAGTAAPQRLALSPWLVGSSPQCSQSHRWSGAEQSRGKQVPGPLPVPSLGTSAALPAATAPGTSLSMLLNYSNFTSISLTLLTK